MTTNQESVSTVFPLWDKTRTESLVTSLFGKKQWDKAHPSARSMTDRPEFCHYHYHEAIGMLEEFIKNRLGEGGLWFALHNEEDFRLLMLRLKANITAFVQSLHALPDTCSHMLYYGLALDRLPKPLKERDIYASKVLAILEQQRDSGQPSYTKLCALFRELTTGDSYKYLNALANTVKHRSVVRSQLNEDATGKRAQKYILYLEPFNYAGLGYPKTDVREFMRKEHDRIQPLTVSIGVELNRVLETLQRAQAS
ncbi:hypothetical protein [Comamonas sp. B-9]|uniref:hypothetical protein n=1 Tax=Comamonas sp. B-9 TaxID=1055192 RepID=UPI0011DE3D45|nr:hypothetical protein [Comamonas sp. B-9]